MSSRTHSRSARALAIEQCLARLASTASPEDRGHLEDARRAFSSMILWCTTDRPQDLATAVAHILDGAEIYKAPIESWILDIDPAGSRP